jgi:Carboxypeptidase regulatory-like domain
MRLDRFRLLARILCAGIATWAWSAPAPVQLQGRVTDENDLPVAAVEVTVRGPNGATQVTHTDEAGSFELEAPAPGDYAVSLAKAGYFRITDHTIHLDQGSYQVAFTLSHEFEVHEAIDVVAPETEINPGQPAAEQSLEARQILDIPSNKTHDLQSYLPSLPSVLRDPSGDLHVAGGRVGETDYRLNGFEIGDPATGGLTSRLNVDTIEAVEVQSGGIGAEYPHAGAGVLSLQTYSGDDRWRFGTTNFLPALSLQQGWHFGNWFPRFNFSGPLRRGRAWFSDALSLQHSFQLISELPRGQNTATQWLADNLIRTQVNLTRDQVLQVDFLFNRTRDAHLGLGPFSPLSTTTDLHAARYFVSVKDQVSWKHSLLEIGWAIDRGHSDRLPQGSATYVLSGGAASGNFFETLHQQTGRTQWIVNWMVPSRQWHGRHDFRAGVNAERVSFLQRATRMPLQVVLSDASTLDQASFTGNPQFRVTNVQAGLYAQDTWRIWGPLAAQLGVRTDWDGIVHRALPEPRAAAIVLPFQDERTKLSVAWGIYDEPISLALWGQALDQQRRDDFSSVDAPAQIDRSVLSRFSLLPGGLEQPRFHTMSVDWSQKLGGSTLLDIEWIRRRQILGLAYEYLPTAPSINDYVLTNNRRDRYQALDISVRHAFASRAELFADYTRSSARSNEVLDYSLGSLFLSPQAPGPLAWDAPNRFISWGWWQTAVWGLLPSYSFESRTGFPFSQFDAAQHLVGMPNQYRFPSYMNLDLGIEKRFRLRSHEWAVRLVAVNVAGRHNPDAVNYVQGSPPVFGGGQGRAFTARIRLVGRK